jgi:SpoVK/Ycf46/Vps4 family AAA+-type ATPase
MSECADQKDCPGRSPESVRVSGIPRDIPKGIADLCEARILEAVTELMDLSGIEDLSIAVGRKPQILETARARSVTSPRSGAEAEQSVEERAEQYVSKDPFFDFEFLVVSSELRESLLSAIDLVNLESTVFGSWNLSSIEPFPRTSLNFHGPPGTGKTLAAHALSSYLKRPILQVSYGQIESKYVGDGAKNVEAVFFATQRDNAVLFIDEADSLLSKRLVNVNQGSEQAINSMRSQLLVCLEQFKGIVIFATNLVENYDRGFETRVRNLYFPMPDWAARQQIWKKHLPEALPLEKNVSARRLADLEDVCGRDIKNAVIDAALRTARAGQLAISLSSLEDAIGRVKSARINADNKG